jgi:hypothetical protein
MEGDALMIDFSSMITWIAGTFTPVFGSGFSIGIALELFIAWLCLSSGAGLLLTVGALFIATFILASMGLLPAAAYIFLVLIAAAGLAYLFFIKPSK